jgi:hypothetical protein
VNRSGKQIRDRDPTHLDTSDDANILAYSDPLTRRVTRWASIGVNFDATISEFNNPVDRNGARPLGDGRGRLYLSVIWSALDVTVMPDVNGALMMGIAVMNNQRRHVHGRGRGGRGGRRISLRRDWRRSRRQHACVQVHPGRAFGRHQ